MQSKKRRVCMNKKENIKLSFIRPPFHPLTVHHLLNEDGCLYMRKETKATHKPCLATLCIYQYMC